MLIKAEPFYPALPVQGQAGRLVLQRLWRMGLALRFRAQQHQQRQRDRAALARMSGRELNDLGIGRGEIAALLDTPLRWCGDRR